MKKITLPFILMVLVASYRLSAQVDCVPNTIKLNNVKNYCSGKAAESNKNAIPSTVAIGSFCPNVNYKDVWYKFTAVASDVTIDIIKGGANGTIKNVTVELLYPCPTGLLCKTSTAADTLRLYKGGLIIGTTYYIRVSSLPVDAGTYTMCIKNTVPATTPAADCDKAIKLCNKDMVHLSQLSGPGNNNMEIEVGSCFIEGGLKYIEQNSYWYYWVCGKAGKLTFDLIPLDANGDLDFIVYEVNGTNICKNRTIVRCSAAQCVYGGKTGLNMTETDVYEGPGNVGCGVPPKNEYLAALNMQLGKTYALFINDAMGKSGFNIKFGGDGEFQGAEAVIATDKMSICEGGSVTFTSNSKNADTLIWNFPGGTPSMVPNTPGPHTITYNKAGTYTATLTAKTSKCYTIDQVDITVNQAPTVTVSNDEICEGEEATLTATPSIPGGTYSWSPTPTSGGNTATIKTNPATDQTYTVTYTVAGCKAATGTGKITVNKKLDVTVNSESICTGGSATLTATLKGTGPYTYVWAPDGEKTASITKSPAATTVYTVTVTSPGGCTGTATATIEVNGVLIVNAGTDTTICDGATVNLKVKPIGNGYTYKWSASAGTVSDPDIYNPTATPTSTTTYTAEVTSDKGCSGSDIITVSIDPLMIPVLTPANVTCNAACDGKLDVNVTGGTAPYTYNWSNGCTSASCTNLCVNTYTVTIKDKIGCVIQGNSKITEPPAFILKISAVNTTCGKPNGTATVVASGGTPGNGYRYLWDDPIKQTTATATGLAGRKYCVTAMDAHGCIKTACVDVGDNITTPLKIAVSTDVNLCTGDSATLMATGSGGDGGPYTYTWAPGGGATGNTITVKPGVSVTYTVTVNDNCGTTPALDSIKVNIHTSPVIAFNGDPLSGCTPVKVNFKDSSSVTGGTITSWKWDFGDDGKSDLKDPVHIFSTTGTTTSVYSVTLTVKSNNGCISVLKKNKMIQVFPIPVANFDAPFSTSILNPLIHFTNTSVGGISWEWNFGDSLCAAVNNTSSLFSPSHSYAAIGNYCVKLLVKNNGGCMDSTYHCIDIDPQFVIFIPNAFTPNGDGHNDVFFAKGEYINDFEMRIFNRWGNMIYYADNINKPWNGKMNNVGEMEQQDVYVYQITIKDNKDKKHEYIGTVTLVRGG